jgi:hypothetical protein
VRVPFIRATSTQYARADTQLCQARQRSKEERAAIKQVELKELQDKSPMMGTSIDESLTG